MLNRQRLTISLPAYLYNLLVSQVETGHLSQFVAKILEKELLRSEVVSDPIDDFFSLRPLLPRRTRSKIKKAIKKGRE